MNEEILIERTVKVLEDNLNSALTEVWGEVAANYTKLGVDKTLIDAPVISAGSYHRWSLEDRAATSDFKIIVNSGLTPSDSTNVGTPLRQYDLSIEIIWTYGQQESDRYSVPARVREGVLRTIEKFKRDIVGTNKIWVADAMMGADNPGEGNRESAAGVLYNIIA